LHRSTNLLIEDCLGREVGRSGVDYEPNNVSHVMVGTLLRRCDFINVRNYGIAIRHWAKNINAVMEDVTTTNCGMGGIDGGGRPMTITNFVHTGTYRTDADRVANGGHTGVDMQLHGINMTVTDVSTTRGIALPDLTNNSNHFPDGPTVTYHPSDIHVYNATVTDPTTDPFVFIEVANSTVEVSGGTTGTTAPTWDDSRYNWDSAEITWDGLLLDDSPAFQLDAFQENAFQVALVVHVFATQTAPAFTQHLAVFAGRAVAIEQTVPSFEQAAEIAVQVAPLVAQTIAAFTQAADVSLIVKGNIGKLIQVFQDDAFDADAFQTQPDESDIAPAFTQHLAGAVVPHGANIGIIRQTVPAFTQAADASGAIAVLIAQTVAAVTQAMQVDLAPLGAITQTVPAFTQHAEAGGVASSGVITQTVPAFTQHLTTRSVRWGEWEVSMGSEWLVTDGDEWLVRT
jgi:hypothetical protein